MLTKRNITEFFFVGTQTMFQRNDSYRAANNKTTATPVRPST